MDLLPKSFSDTVYVNSCPLFPVPYSLFPIPDYGKATKVVIVQMFLFY
ncbi:MAG: hypothetical protein F6K50_07210 [Moorea sp. SIO3I7]|nr:hypothetical protein [Moorena sp. SIO3I7]